MTWRLRDHRKNRRYNYTYCTRTEVRKYFQKYKKVHRYCTFESTFVLSKVISYESTLYTYVLYKVVTFEGIIFESIYSRATVQYNVHRKYLQCIFESTKVLSYVVLSYNLRTKILFFRYNVLRCIPSRYFRTKVRKYFRTVQVVHVGPMDIRYNSPRAARFADLSVYGQLVRDGLCTFTDD